MCSAREILKLYRKQCPTGLIQLFQYEIPWPLRKKGIFRWPWVLQPPYFPPDFIMTYTIVFFLTFQHGKVKAYI